MLCKEEPASFILSHYSHSDTVLYGAQHIERLSSEGEESNKRTCVCKRYVLMRALHKLSLLNLKMLNLENVIIS